MTQDNTKVLSRIRELVQPFAESLGLTLWGTEIAGGSGRPVLRVFIDGPEGVDVEQCARVSRQLAVALDVEELMHGAYDLEVSSPGLERRFFELSQLPPYVGQELDVTLEAPAEGRKRFKGVFTALTGETLSMECEGKAVSFPWGSVAKARLVYTFETPEESKAKARAKGKKTLSKADKPAPRGDGA
jgi:ribosome maturation factor RimP